MSDRIPRFRPWRPASAVKPDFGRAEPRPSPQERGLDGHWTRLALRFRRANPFCRFCEQEGNDAVLADVVDHIFPRREYPQFTYVWEWLESLCARHHGLKSRMEDFARETGQLDKLPFWCEAVENRPAEILAIPPELWGRGRA